MTHEMSGFIEEFWQHYPFNDPVPCGIDPGAVTLDTEPYLTEDQQQVLDKMSFEIGIQLGNYVGKLETVSPEPCVRRS